MKAIYIERTGPPEVLVERQVSSPEPRPDEVRIAVGAAGGVMAAVVERPGG